MDFSTRLNVLKKEIAALEVDPIRPMLEGSESDLDGTLPATLLWLSERQQLAAMQSISGGGLLTEAMCPGEAVTETAFDFTGFNSKEEIHGMMKEIRELERELEHEMKHLRSLKIDDIVASEPFVIKQLEKQCAEDIEAIQESTVLAQKRKREEQLAARQAEQETLENKVSAEAEEKKQQQVQMEFDELEASLEKFNIRITSVDPDAIFQLTIGELRIPWFDRDLQALNVARATFTPKGHDAPLCAEGWKRISRFCGDGTDGTPVVDVLAHVMEYFRDDV
eukprot:GEMP01063760.1.p1 GENE.GEMP01063760.1~~GEMP01063760.1.p1  ORF type:complete len:280 (-),score=79.91 GEMP01063760.1:437-1276(-)